MGSRRGKRKRVVDAAADSGKRKRVDTATESVKEESTAIITTQQKLSGPNAADGTKLGFNRTPDALAKGLQTCEGGPDTNWMQLQALLYKCGPGRRKKSKPSPAEPAKGDTAPEAVAAEVTKAATSLTPVNSDFSVTKHIAMDCEMVGVGHEGTRSVLARITLVNKWGNVIYDKHVRPLEPVTDFRTKISGIRRSDLKTAEKFSTVQQEVANLISGKFLIGHALHNDLKVLFLSHPRKDMRDTHRFKRFWGPLGRPQSLQHLAAMFLGVSIQEGEHSPVEDARASMLLYQRFKVEWEKSCSKRKSGEPGAFHADRLV